ncbi:proton-conducting transporter membrane subunit [Yoonia sp.]|uniref:proton-conducting transporter transmembrane domain-containing protein n=1 Tax=Yoonia sp. TaxID=2212373 RepID=UPI0035C7F085
MPGLILADNLLILLDFWELTSITSYVLIGFNHEAAKSRLSALQALMVTGVGGLALLAGVLLIGTTADTFEMSQINQMSGVLTQSVMYLPIVSLGLAGAFTKSAQFPLPSGCPTRWPHQASTTVGTS